MKPKLLVSIIGCELIGIVGAVFTAPAIPTWYASLNKPSFAPPNWLFGPTWTLLYFLMGISFYLTWRKSGGKKKIFAIRLFFAQLAFNFLWSPLFFGLKSPLLGLIDIIILLTLIIITIKKLFPLSKPAAYLLLPYFLWVSFATLLNISIFLLN